MMKTMPAWKGAAFGEIAGFGEAAQVRAVAR